MRKLSLLITFLLFFCINIFAQQQIYIQLADTTLKFNVWDVKEISFAPVEPLVPAEAAEPVDLGLSVKWSSFNLGASSSEEKGYLVGWGDPSGQVHSADLKYFPKRVVTSDIISGSYDIAAKMWGDQWRLPSSSEIQELIDSCTWTWNGKGYTVTSKINNNSIFLPATGYLNINDTVATPSFYWTGMHNGTVNAYALKFDANKYALSDTVRYLGCAIRPVYGEYKLPVTVTASTVGNAGEHSAKINVTISGYLKDMTKFGVCYASTTDSLTNHTAKVKEFTQSDIPESGSLEVELTGLKEGTLYYYQAFASSDNDTVYSTQDQFTTSTRFPVAEYVDLGLPSGTKWAKWNMGAKQESDYGGYYGWGDATGDLDVSNSNLRSADFSKGNKSENVAGNVSFDIVKAKWGGYWQMPTSAQLLELANSNYTTWEFVSNYEGSGHNGYVIKSNQNHNSIFLPIPGYKNHDGVTDQNSSSYYWSANYDVRSTMAYVVHFYGVNDGQASEFSPNLGFSIRGVYMEPIVYPADSAVAKNVKAVDLGLSVCWADQNIKSKDDPSKDAYFSWGSIAEQSTYSRDSYQYQGENISTMDEEILPEDKDAAVQLWGGTWRMPTIDEMSELVNNCTWTKTSSNGVEGYRVTGPNGNSIFLPIDGYKSLSQLYSGDGRYWTSTDYSKGSVKDEAYAMFFTDTQQFISSFTRAYGLPIRPVRARRQ